MELKSMNIFADEGTKVTPAFKDGKPFGGYSADEEKVAQHLKEGEWYTVEYTEVHNWSTDVFLKEFPNVRFNSVNLLEKEKQLVE